MSDNPIVEQEWALRYPSVIVPEDSEELARQRQAVMQRTRQYPDGYPRLVTRDVTAWRAAE